MKTRISALLDGELDSDEARATLDALRSRTDLRTEWRSYHVIGEVMRGELAATSCCDGGRLNRVMAALEQEPTILAPRQKTVAEPLHEAGGVGNVGQRGWSPGRYLRPAYVTALAASLAGVALVSWVALDGQASGLQGKPEQQASLAPKLAMDVKLAEPEPVSAATKPVAVPRALKRYLVAHTAQAAKVSPKAEWHVRDAPPGYQRVAVARRSMQHGGPPTVQLVYSNGTSSASVFIDESTGRGVDPGLPEVASLGPVNVYQRRMNDGRVLVMGDAPETALRRLGDSLERQRK